MKKQNIKIKNLSKEIHEEKINKFINDFDNAMNKKIKNDIKKVLVLLGIITLSLTTIFVLNNPIGLMIGTCLMSISFVSIQLIEQRKKSQKEKIMNNNQIIPLNSEDTIESLLEKGIDNNEYYYTSEYKKVLEEVQQDHNLINNTNKRKKLKNNIKIIQLNSKDKVESTLEKRIDNNDNCYTSIPKKELEEIKYSYNQSKQELERITLNKKESMIQITEEIEAYYRTHNLPPFEITNEEWKIFFSEVYEFCFKENLQKEYYNIMSNIIRITLSEILVNNRKSVSIINILKNLSYFEKYKVEKDSLEELSNNIITKTNKPVTQIIKFDSKPKRKL